MMGIIYSIIAGIAMTLQGVFNTKASEKMGLWETNAFVQGTAFIITIIIALLFGKGSFFSITEVNKLYLTGGILGAIITFTVMMGIGSLSPTCAIGIILIAQLLSAALVDAFGLFGNERCGFGFTKIIGIALMILGIVLFKWKTT